MEIIALFAKRAAHVDLKHGESAEQVSRAQSRA
jgi:hypothetical protein